MPKIQRVVEEGFTLVELLVVVALIGILAVAVLSTINPIEQANRARDAAYKNDAAEIVNAEERFYTTTQAYPWSTTSTPFALGWIDASSAEVGICDATSGCPTAGALITGEELRNEFAQRPAFQSTALPVDKMYVGRSDTSSGSVYVCFIPKSNTTRNTAGTATTALKAGFAAADGSVAVASTGPATCSTAPSGTSTWTDVSNSCLVCVPQ